MQPVLFHVKEVEGVRGLFLDKAPMGWGPVMCHTRFAHDVLEHALWGNAIPGWDNEARAFGRFLIFRPIEFVIGMRGQVVNIIDYELRSEWVDTKPRIHESAPRRIWKRGDHLWNNHGAERRLDGVYEQLLWHLKRIQHRAEWVWTDDEFYEFVDRFHGYMVDGYLTSSRELRRLGWRHEECRALFMDMRELGEYLMKTAEVYDAVTVSLDSVKKCVVAEMQDKGVVQYTIRWRVG
ncbi:hypothetical protein EBT31_11410 [bacterium]|nr:hypothetical protein [bacterium]